MVSELAVEPEGAVALEHAFRYLMVSWWTSKEAFASWMHSEAHHRSHDRIPEDPAPKPVRFDRYQVIAT